MDYVELDLREHMDQNPESSDLDNVKVSRCKRALVQGHKQSLLRQWAHNSGTCIVSSVQSVCAVVRVSDTEGNAVLSCASSPTSRPEATERPL